MKTLLTTQSLPMLLLLLQTLPLQVVMGRRLIDFSDARKEEFEDYIGDLQSTGPTKPPTRKIFYSHVIISDSLPLYSDHDCTMEMMYRNVHDRFYCRKEHFFLSATYWLLAYTCTTEFVPCKNGVRRCHKTREIVEGMYCKLTDGLRMTNCKYDTVIKRGYALITCRWQDDVEELIPEHVDDILEISGK